MVGRDQYGYIKGPNYMVKPGSMPPGEHNKVESKKLHKLGKFPKLRAASARGKAFSNASPNMGKNLRCIMVHIYL